MVLPCCRPWFYTLVVMGKLLWLEIKALARRPTWLIFLALFSLVYFGIPNIEPSIEPRSPGYEFYGPPRIVASLGEWGRAGLLLPPAIFAMLVSLLTVGSFGAETAHREPLWATPKVTNLATGGAKLLSIATFAIFLTFLGSVTAFFNPSNRKVLAMAGGLYVPLYFALAWVQAAFWAAISAFLLHLVRSRWATVLIVTAAATFWLSAGQWFPRAFSVFFDLLYRSYLSWNFVSPFAPLGMIPHLLALQALSLLGLVLALFAGAMLIRRRFPEWRGLPLRTIQVTLGAGIILALGAGVGVAVGIQSRIAPFELFEFEAPPLVPFVEPPPEFTRPYIWTRDGVLIFFPGEHAMVRQAFGSLLPEWMKKLAEGKVLRRLERRLSSVVLIYPPGSPFPAELEGLARSLDLLLKRAEIWRKASQIIVAPPTSEIGFEDTPDGLFVSFETLTDWAWGCPVAQGRCAWALTSSSGLPDPERVYLALYLLEGLDNKQVSEYLEKLRLKATGKLKDEKLFYLLYPLWKDNWGESEAIRILNHWEQGEKIGHENYIRMLLQGEGR